MSLIGMVVYCTEESNKDEHFKKTLQGLSETVDFSKHELGISINGHTEKTLETIKHFDDIITYKYLNGINLGTSEAINKVLRNRKSGQHFVKIDDDIYVHDNGWLEQFEEVVYIDETIGQCAAKRNDLWENVSHENPFYRTTLYQLPHKAGDRWVTVEITNHCIGSLVLHSSNMLDRTGYFLQPSKYGGDDSLFSHRSQKAGFKNVFLPHIAIDHLDNPSKEWQSKKEKMFHDAGGEFYRLRSGILNGEIPYYYNPYDKN